MNEQPHGDAQIVTVSDPPALAREAANRFVAAAQSAIADHDAFRVALSGGSTPHATYEVLASPEYRDQVEWDRVQVFFSDERFVPADSPESNFRMAKEVFLNRVPIPERFVHQVATFDITPEESAALYEQGMRRVFEVDLVNVPRFDLILLGLGPDGHTASLFPGTEALDEEVRLVAPNFIPRLNSWRITFTYLLLNGARCVMFLVQGSDKAERVLQVLRGDTSLPASRVHPTSGELVWILDGAAAPPTRPE